MGHNIKLTIYDDYIHSKSSLEFIKVLREANIDLCVQDFETIDDFGKEFKNDLNVEDPFKTKIDIRVVNKMKYNGYKSVKILCMYLLKNGIVNFKILNYD